MEAVKVRDQYQQALLLLSNLQHQPATYARALPKLFHLIRLCYSVQKAATLLQDKDSNSLWQQRSATLYRDLTTATAQFLQTSYQSGEQFWNGCLQLLYAGAEACDQIEIEKLGLVTQLAAMTEQYTWLEKNLQSEHQKLEMAEKERMELRSKISIQQQIIEPLEKNYRDVHHRLDTTIKEKHALSAEKTSLADECSRNRLILDGQGNTIQQLMEQCETCTKERNDALESISSISNDNHILRVNLGQHGQVIENLININAEMMDAANRYAVQLEQKKLLDQQQLEKAALVTDSNRSLVSEIVQGRLDGIDLEIISTTPPQIPPQIPQTQKIENSVEGIHNNEASVINSDNQSPSKTIGNQASLEIVYVQNSAEIDREASLETIHNHGFPEGRKENRASVQTDSTGNIWGPSPDFFSRIKGIGSSYDSPGTVLGTEQMQHVIDHPKVISNGEVEGDPGGGKRKTVNWTSDLPTRSASIDNLQGLLGVKGSQANGSTFLENLNDRKESLPTSGSPGLFSKLGGMGGRLQGVGGKAKGFLNFVAGADLAPQESLE